MRFRHCNSMTIPPDSGTYLRWTVTPNLAFFTVWKQVKGEWVDGSFVYGSDEGFGIEVYDAEFRLVRRINSDQKNLFGGGIATSPNGAYTAILRPGHIAVEATTPFVIESDNLDGTGDRDAHFSADGRFLWIAKAGQRFGRDRETRPWIAVVDTRMKTVGWDSPSFVDAVFDKHGDYGLHLSAHPSGMMVLWVVAFNYVRRYWASFKEGRFEYTLESESEDSLSLHFDGTGARYLTSNNNSLSLKSFPDGRDLGLLEFSSPEDWHNADAEEESFSDSSGFISDDYALINTNDPVLLLVHLRSMTVVDTIRLPGTPDPFYSDSSGGLITVGYEKGTRCFDRWQFIG